MLIFKTITNFVVKDINYAIFHLYGTQNIPLYLLIRRNLIRYNRKKLQRFGKNFAGESTILRNIRKFAIFVYVLNEFYCI